MILLFLHLLCTTEQACAAGSNETGLLTLCCVSRDCGSFANMLMITTTVGLQQTHISSIVQNQKKKKSSNTHGRSGPRARLGFRARRCTVLRPSSCPTTAPGSWLTRHAA